MAMPRAPTPRADAPPLPRRSPSLRGLFLWGGAALAVAADALSPGAGLYLARCSAANAWFDPAWLRFDQHLSAFPWSGGFMIAMCALAPQGAWRRWLPRAAWRTVLMLATMPLACALAWFAADGVAAAWQPAVFAATMLAAGALLAHAAMSFSAAVRGPRAAVP